MVKKRHITEESVESKPLSHSSEPATLKGEAKKLADEAMKQTWDQLFAGSLSTASEQLLGFDTGGDLHEGQEVSLKKQAHHAETALETAKAVTSEHMEYFREINNSENIGERRTEHEMRQAVDEIRMEIKRLMSTSKLVEQSVKDASADKTPVKPGKYHLNFFQFVLSVIREATQKLEDSVTFGSVLSGKKQQSKYWNSYKQHGTSFGLSSERSTATQTG